MKKYFLLLLSTLSLLHALGQSDLQKIIDADYSYLENLYLHLHRNPELSFYEFETASRMAAELRALGFDVTEKVGGNGVVGPPGMVRADMDALPIVEETGLPYASTVKVKDEAGTEVGVMHACGHDTHMTSWVGAARALVKLKAQWRGTLVFIGQPAEERNGGGKNMLDGGLYQRFPKPNYVLALHAAPNVPAGKIGGKA
ncbi:MAG TPA: M20/M25/M40 family metallo-hydrolase [Saprospiraceae bacterium]|nr:M20/M25/M40 family metallo-hydrolase [Saprospiraceae bacterium]